MIRDCTCTHLAQDVLYGRGRRVFNPLKPKAGGKCEGFRCTVCGKQASAGDHAAAVKGKAAPVAAAAAAPEKGKKGGQKRREEKDKPIRGGGRR